MLKRFSDDPLLVLFDCYAIAELEGSEAALQLYRQEIRKSTVVRYMAYLSSIPLLLGRVDLARAESGADSQRNLYFRPREQAFFQKVRDYVAGVANETDLLQATAGSKTNESRARYFIGLMRLAEGDRFRASEQFRMVLASSCPNTFCFVSLERLKKDPTWPPWIPVKK